MQTLLRIAVFGASVWASNRYAGGYWVVGPVFGAAVVFFDLKSLKNLQIVKYLAFIGASTLIYALVYRISRLDWGGETDLYKYFIGSFQAAIVTGSILMAVAHSIFFGKNKDVMVRAILGLVGSFYVINFLSYFNERSHMGWDISWLTVMIAVWQGAYLYLFFF